MSNGVPEYSFEKELQDYLDQHPGQLEEGLVLIAREMSVSAGNIDLLGIDQEGKLVVIELKRADVSREAIAQALDYTAALNYDELDDLIAAIEADGYIDATNGFEQWYLDSFDADGILDLWPARVLVAGNRIDDSADRTASFLNDVYGLSVTTRSFHRYVQGGEIEFSPITRLEPQSSPPDGGHRAGPAAVNRIASALPSWEAFSDARDLIRNALPDRRYGNTVGDDDAIGYGITAPEATLEGLRWRWAFTLRAFRDSPDQIAITVFPISIHLAPDLVAGLEEEIPSGRSTEGPFDRTHGNYYIYFRFETVVEWHRHRPKVEAAIEEIGRQWYRIM